MILSRRDLLAGTAATASALSLGLSPSELLAAAPPAGKQAASFYRYKVGDFEVTQIADGARTFPMPDQFVVNQKKEDALKAAEEAYLPKGQVTIVFNPMVINTGSKLVLIDTGNGLGAFDQTKGAVGQLNANMQAAGIDPKAIDIVLISHFHGDHMNGLKKADGSLVYPNAEVKVPSVEQKFWADESNASKTQRLQQAELPEREEGVRRYQGDRIRLGQGSRARYHGDRHAGAHARPHLVCRLIGQRQAAGAVRRDKHLDVRRTPRLARHVRQRSGAGADDAAQVLRHGGRREAAGRGLSFLVPVAWPYRKGRRRIPAGAGRLESDDLSHEGRDHMANISRRSALLGTAAATCVTALASPVWAAAPAAGKQAPGFYRYKVGDVEVTVITDGVIRAPLPADFVSNTKIEDVKAALTDLHMSPDIFNNTYTPVVLNTGGKLVLIDTGVGRGGLQRHQGHRGPAPEQPRGGRTEAGVDRYGRDLALSRRPHERPVARRQLDQLPERRNPRAGE